ncbi:unnamed protein product [Eruca vesicaria subsp. sativa]|uniref:Uncharacterized protein n=1 Tax=Eruca vesicaria subsp. sativa TaxID=29727 RepID=A0ABC8KWE1_ERUVS|nr:unnamed protein product [Eruca vesicaria subsp. sativa]
MASPQRRRRGDVLTYLACLLLTAQSVPHSSTLFAATLFVILAYYAIATPPSRSPIVGSLLVVTIGPNLVVLAPPTTLTVVAPPSRVNERTKSVQPEGNFTGSVNLFTPASPPSFALSQPLLSRLCYSPERAALRRTLHTRFSSSIFSSTPPQPVTPLSRHSSSPGRVTTSHHLFPTLAFCLGLFVTDTLNIEAAPSRQGFYGAKLHRLNLLLLVTTGSIVQECCFAGFFHDYFTTASLSHYVVSSIDGSSQSRICARLNLLVADLIVQECGLARFTSYITVALPSQYAVSSIDGSSQSQLRDLSDSYSHMLNRNEFIDSLLKFLPVISWPRHGNVKVQASDPIKPYASSPNSIVLSASIVKLELEIHLVSWVSIVDVRAVHLLFIDKSRLSRPFDTTSVEKDSPVAPFQTLMFGFINVDSDNLKLVFSSVLGKQVKNHLYGFLLFEQVSSFNMSILCRFVLPLFILPSRLAAPVVIILSVLLVLV